MIKRLLRVVELTVPEQRVVIFALLALLTWVALKSWREAAKAERREAPAAAIDQPSPSPGIRP
jgi:hypothetical protein